jgi:2-(1,2-epoxy-1,2-dihydrophenyl)acetyl-CoA isomerase
MERYGTIKADIRDGYLDLSLNRPEAMNALNQQVAQELSDALDRISDRDDVRAVLLRGEGRAFCAGGDVKEMERSLEGNPAEFFEGPLVKIHEAARALARLHLPVVGALHGFVSGAGFNLALCCDLLLCGAETRFNQAFIRIGLVPDTGGTYFLPRMVGTKRALELMLLGDFVDAERALSFGLVNRVVPEDDLVNEARALAQRLASGPTRAYAEIKKLVQRSPAGTLAEILAAELQAQLRAAATEDFQEGVRAFLEKRPPRFEGR